MRSDNSRHIIDAARQRSQYTRAKAIQALRTLDAAGEPVTFESVAQKAGVSRSWLYTEPDVRAEIEQLRAAHPRTPVSPVPARQRTSEASLLRRLEAANDRIRQLTQENKQLREHLARALGEQRATTRRPSPRPDNGERPETVTIHPL
jgi:hypothetical protein